MSEERGPLNTKQVIAAASRHLLALKGKVFDIITVSKPTTLEEATNLSKVISKLSPIIGNMIEFHAVELLNEKPEFSPFGKWKRQDPGFPDAIFQGSVTPLPGFEIKAWFPLATEITARFKDSQNHFVDDKTYVALLAWLPQYVLFGKPQIIDVCVVSGLSIAKARDDHYHNPPDYVVVEPGNTDDRTQNLKQTNTSGYKWQGTAVQFAKAQKIVDGWGKNGNKYLPTPAYQERIKQLTNSFPYRLDTNFAKMDRIVHTDTESFKLRIEQTIFNGKSIAEWKKIISGESTPARTIDFKKLLNL
jgi:hypothetical protein